MPGDVFDVSADVAPILETDADGRLFYEGNRAGFSRFDRSYIAVAAKAFATGRDIALVYPSPPSHVQIPILLAVGFQSRSTEPALFVSNRSGIRDQYFNLGLGPKFAPQNTIEPNSLGDVTAPMVRTGDGNSLSYITHHKPTSWDPENPDTAAIIHTTFGKKITRTLSGDLDLSGFVLDFTTGLLDNEATQEAYRELAKEREIPRVMIFDSPNHSYLKKLQQQSEDDEEVLFWGWAPSALESAPRELLEPISDTPADGDEISMDGGGVQSPFTDSVRSLENIRSGIGRSIVNISHGELEEAATRAYERLGTASQFPNQTTDSYSSASRRVITNGYFLYMYLDTLPISVEFHDSLTSLEDTKSWGTGATLRSKVDKLREQASQLDRDVPGSGGILEEACDAFDIMIDLLTEHNAKADEIVEQIRSIRENDDEVCVLTATRKQESLLRSFVAEKTEFGRGDDLTESIHFHSLYRPHTVPAVDVAVFPGVPTKSHYPTVQTGAAPDQRFITYDWEVDRLKSRLNDIDRTANRRVGSDIQQRTAQELDLGTETLNKYVHLDGPRQPGERPTESARESHHDSDTENSEISVSSSTARSKPESERVGTSPTLSNEDLSLDMGTLTPDLGSVDENEAWESELEFDDGDERETINEGRTNTSTDGDDEVEALKIVFTDEQLIYEEPEGLIWSLEPTEDGSVRRTRRAAASLQPGDEVLLIEEDSRRDVFEHVVEKIHDECRGTFTRNIMMLDLWTSGVDQMVDHWRELEEIINADPSEPPIEMTQRQMATMIADELEHYAAEHDEPEVEREPATVLQYLNRNTIGPSDPATIEAIGEIHEIESLQNHSEEIHHGLEEIRRLHMRVGRKLEQIIFTSRDADSDEWILKEAGLRVSDVQNATVVKRVESVSSDTFVKQTHELGKLLSGG